jgi:hypothetical protein
MVRAPRHPRASRRNPAIDSAYLIWFRRFVFRVDAIFAWVANPYGRSTDEKVSPMPVHDWTRVSAGTFHDSHCTWISQIKNRLNEGVLPPRGDSVSQLARTSSSTSLPRWMARTRSSWIRSGAIHDSRQRPLRLCWASFWASKRSVFRRMWLVSDGLITDGRPPQAKHSGMWYWPVDSQV